MILINMFFIHVTVASVFFMGLIQCAQTTTITYNSLRGSCSSSLVTPCQRGIQFEYTTTDAECSEMCSDIQDCVAYDAFSGGICVLMQKSRVSLEDAFNKCESEKKQGCRILDESCTAFGGKRMIADEHKKIVCHIKDSKITQGVFSEELQECAVSVGEITRLVGNLPDPAVDRISSISVDTNNPFFIYYTQRIISANSVNVQVKKLNVEHIEDETIIFNYASLSEPANAPKINTSVAPIIVESNNANFTVFIRNWTGQEPATAATTPESLILVYRNTISGPSRIRVYADNSYNTEVCNYVYRIKLIEEQTKITNPDNFYISFSVICYSGEILRVMLKKLSSSATISKPFITNVLQGPSSPPPFNLSDIQKTNIAVVKKDGLTDSEVQVIDLKSSSFASETISSYPSQTKYDDVTGVQLSKPLSYPDPDVAYYLKSYEIGTFLPDNRFLLVIDPDENKLMIKDSLFAYNLDDAWSMFIYPTPDNINYVDIISDNSVIFTSHGDSQQYPQFAVVSFNASCPLSEFPPDPTTPLSEYVNDYGISFRKGAYNKIGTWDISKQTNLDHLFSLFDASKSITDSLHGWDVTLVTSVALMFDGSFHNGTGLENWDLKSLTNYTSMFENALLFNADIGSWDVSRAEIMDKMFKHAESFDADISRWNVGKVSSFSSMFESAVRFQSVVGTWVISKQVVSMDRMFYNASLFFDDISLWKVNPNTNTTNMLNYSSLKYCFLVNMLDHLPWRQNKIFLNQYRSLLHQDDVCHVINKPNTLYQKHWAFLFFLLSPIMVGAVFFIRYPH